MGKDARTQGGRRFIDRALRTFLKDNENWAYIKDADFVYQAASDRMARACGRATGDDLVGKTDFDLFDEELAAKYREDDLTVLRTGEPLRGVIEQFPDEAGTMRWASTWKRPLFDDDGNVVGLYGTSIDATRTVNLEARHEEAKRQLEEAHRTVKTLQGGLLAVSCFNVTQDTNVDVTHDKIVSLDEAVPGDVLDEAIEVDGRIEEQREETREVLLRAASQIPDERQREQFLLMCSHHGMLDAYARGERDLRLEYRRQTDEGLLWVETRITLTADPETGDVLAYFYTTDINRQMIEQLVMGRLVNYGFDNASYLDLSSRQLYLVDMEQNSLAMPPRRSDYDETNARSIPEFIHPDDQDLCREAFAVKNILEHLKHEDVYSIYYRLNVCREDLPGQPHVRMRMSVFYLDDVHDILVFCRSDVTSIYEAERAHRKELERALDEAEHARAAQQSFLSSMSHDMRTPLNGILGFSSLALGTDDPELQRDYLQKIESSGQLMLRLVNDVLDISKIASGKMELHPEVFDIYELTEHILNTVRVAAEEKGVELVVDIADAGSRLIMTDKLRLQQVVLNLLSNAVKFTPAGGTVTYEVRAVEGEGGINRRVRVIDTGIGMSEDFLPIIFEPFTQERGSGGSLEQGTGLGLSIVKNIVTLMGGSIEVESKLGQGSTFTVWLPIREADEGEHEGATTEEDVPVTTGVQVLLCEDNDLNAEIAEVVLRERMQAQVTRAADGREGLQAFAASPEGHFDVVLMDIRMPVMNGYQATEAIRALDRADAARVPIIAMTADAYSQDVQHCRDAGMDDHLAKPIDPARVVQVISRLVRAYRYGA